MPTRREARERALSLCYELDVRGVDADTLLAQLPAPPDGYAEAIVRGVESHRDEVDAILRKVSEHWALERMPLVDRAVLRIGCYDPVNLMSYVVYVLQKLFGYSREKATRLMLQVHHEGKAAVSEGTREKAEADVARLHAHGLWATMEHPS